MRKRITKFVATIGLALGLVVMGGSVIGGIALAMDHGQPPAAPAPVSDTTSDGYDVADAMDQDSDEQSSPEQSSDEQSSDEPGRDDQSSDPDGDDGTSDDADDGREPDDD